MGQRVRRVSSVSGTVSGRFQEEVLVCQFTDMVNSGGYLWSGGDPFSFTLPVFLAQLAVILTLSRTLYVLLEPLKQSILSAQLIAGIILGRSFLGRIGMLSEELFPPGGRITLETAAGFGLIFHLFILGIHVDPTIVSRTGKHAVTIGLSGFLLPFTIGILAALFLPRVMQIEDEVQESILRIATLNSMSSFPVIASLLSDLKILNSDIGRMATSACAVNECFNYMVYALLTVISSIIRYKRWNLVWFLFWGLALFTLYLYVARPWMFHIARTTPEGRPLKEFQFLAIVLSALICGFVAELMGIPAGIGAFIIGIAIPDGPPIGTYLIQKLDTFCSGLLLPAKFALTGLSMDIFSFSKVSSGIAIELVIILGYLGKFAGVLLSALYLRMPSLDAVCLALVMCCKGIVEVTVYIMLKENKVIDEETYALLLITMLVVAGIARPLISHIYDPSRRYSSQQVNSISATDPKSDLRILVCLHNEENVPTIINLLEASHSSRGSPISVFILNLIELRGRANAVLERNVYGGKLSSMRSKSEHIAKAFSYFVQKNPGISTLQHFTSISPYASMHVDICTIAAEARANIVIIPFHKIWEIDGTIGKNLPAIRSVNQKVILKAPCSVGILVDRGHIAGNRSMLLGNTKFFITLVFLGGPDDREALAYGSRMVGHPSVYLTLIWLTGTDHTSRYGDAATFSIEYHIDFDAISQFRAHTIGNERVFYREEMAKDAVCTTRVLRSMEGACDLCIVGREHDPDSPLTQGLTDWSEYPELGDVGDILSSSDFRFSLLVVQQLPPGVAFPGARHLQTVSSGRSLFSN